MTSRGLSNLPPGGGYVRPDQQVKHNCPACGTEWEATMYFELGGWFYVKDDDANCPECGTEGDCED